MKRTGKILLALVSLVLLGSASYRALYTFEPAVIEGGNPKIDKIRLQQGFKIEHLMSPSDMGIGSWVSMTFDDKGRMICSDQYGGLFRLTLAPVGSSEKPKIEKFLKNQILRTTIL